MQDRCGDREGVAGRMLAAGDRRLGSCGSVSVVSPGDAP